MLLSLPWLATVVSLLPAATAFYPYHQPTSDDLDLKQASYKPLRRSPQSNEGTLTLSLRRRPNRRDNAFTVIPAATPKQSKSLGVDQDGTDFSYFCTFQFGSSTKNYYLLLDSAASNTWVMGNDCTTDACRTHNTLGSRDSTSLKTTQTPFSVVYGTGSVSGVTATDTLKTASFSIPFTFGLANVVSNDFLSYPMDGIIGFGRADQVANGATNVKAPTFMDVLVSQKIITSKVFGLYLWRTSDGGRNDGEINFGSPNTNRFTGKLNYISALKNTNGFWEIPIDNAGVDGKMVGISGRTAIIDSGTSFLLMPRADAEKLHAMIPGSTQNGESFTVPCNTKLDLQVVFGGTTYPISYRDYVGKSASESSGNDCLSNIIGRQTFDPNQWLVGDVFLKNVYTVFDYDAAKVGLGVKAAGSAAATSSTTSDGLSPTPVLAVASTSNTSGSGLIPPSASSVSSAGSSTGNASSNQAGSDTRAAASSVSPTVRPNAAVRVEGWSLLLLISFTVSAIRMV